MLYKTATGQMAGRHVQPYAGPEILLLAALRVRTASGCRNSSSRLIQPREKCSFHDFPEMKKGQPWLKTARFSASDESFKIHS